MKPSSRSGFLFATLLLAAVPAAAVDDWITFDYLNTGQGSTTVLTVNTEGAVRIDTLRTKGGGGKSSRKSLSPDQMDRLQHLLAQINPRALDAAYGPGPSAPEQVSYRFRIRDGADWKETRIDPVPTAPAAPPPLVDLMKFMMALIYPR